MSRSALAAEAGLDRTFLGRIEDGALRPSLETYARIAGALGADVSARLYPNTGPSIRDRHQARIAEGLVGALDPRWRPFLEVAVRRPARGWIDVVLHDPTARLVLAVEIESALTRIEQLIRWSAEKATSLPSWDAYSQFGEVATTSRLLLVRRTRATAALAADFPRQLEIAYPAHPADAVAALRGERDWPGPAMVWVEVRERVKFLEVRERRVR